MKNFKEFIRESELENYRKEALIHIKNNSQIWRDIASNHMKLNFHKVVATGSVTNKNKFNENSDIDVAFHYRNPNEPKGLDEKKSQQLQQLFINHPHPHLGVINTLVFNS